MGRADVFDIIRARLRAEPARPPSEGLAEASVAALLSPGAGDGLDVLLIRRSERPGDPWSGQMALPGGRRDPADADALDTAVREAFEETGVRLAKDRLLGELEVVEPMTPSAAPLLVRPFVFALAAKPRLRPSGEVALHLWVGLDALAGSSGPAEVSFQGRRRQVPAFFAAGHVVWGITYRILSRLLSVVPPR